MSRFVRTTPSNGNSDKPVTSGNSVHGAFTALRLYRERDLDLRRSDHRAIHEWQLALIEDLGGQSQVDTFQRSMVDRATEILIIISAMATHVENTTIMQGNELAPCLRSSFLAYNNTFRHTLLAAFEHGGKKQKKSLSLKDYLSKNYPPKEEQTDDSRESIPKENGRDGGSETRRRYGDESD